MLHHKQVLAALMASAPLAAMLASAAPTEKRQSNGILIPKLSAHQHETDCAHAPALSCGWGYPSFGRKSSPYPCSGLLSTDLPIPCGSCVKVTCNSKHTYVHMISTAGSAFDISFTNYVEIAEPANYAQAQGRSGAGTDPFYNTCTYDIVDGAQCDATIPGGAEVAPTSTIYTSDI